MLPTLNLKRAKPDDQVESSDQPAAVATAAEESCPSPDQRTARDPSLRMEPSFSASTYSTPDFTAERIVLTAERIVPRVDAERLISRVDTERLTPRVDTERLTPRTDSVFPSAEFPPAANDLGPVEDQPSIRLDSEPSAFGRAMKRALVGFVIMVGGATVTMGWQHFGDDAKQLAKGFTPNLPLVSWLHLKHQDTETTAGTSTASASSAETADASAPASQDTTQATDTPPADSSQPAADQQAAPQQAATPQQAAAPQAEPAASPSTDAPPTAATAAAAPPPEVTQLTQSVQALTREVASLQKAMAELKTNNEQMTRDIAKLNERNTARRAATPPRPTPAPTAQAQRPASPVHSSATPRPVSQYQPPARPYPAPSQEVSAATPRSITPPPPVYSQQPPPPPSSYAQPRTYYADPSGYADSSPAPRPPAAVP